VKSPKKDKQRNGKTQEAMWREREKLLEELLEKNGENPKAKEDFNRLLEEMAQSSE